MNQRNEIIIIGGGVIGACIAYYLSGKKHDVALLEKNQYRQFQERRPIRQLPWQCRADRL